MEILSSVASGQLDSAPLALAAMELEIFDSEGDAALSLLEDGESRVIAHLAARDPEALVPILVLHLETHRNYLRDRLYSLLGHAGERVDAIARTYVELSSTELAGEVAADALATLGADLQTARARPQALRMFSRALELDPRNRFARLSLAIGYEGSGRYEDAVLNLKELMIFDPSFEEGRLRLAVNLHRIGESSEATRYLRDLLAPAITPWIRSLAYQELARIHLDQGRPGAAADLLRDGVRRMPDQPRLIIQLAYALDRAGAVAESSQIMLQAENADPRSGATPRSIYNSSISAGLASAENSLSTQSMTRLPALGASLATP